VLLIIAGAAGLYAVSVVVPVHGSAHVLLRVALAAAYFGILRLAGFGGARELRLVREWVAGIRRKGAS
jgi:hypothetical protein